MFMIFILWLGHVTLRSISENTIDKRSMKKKLQKKVTIIMLDDEAKVAELEIIISESYVLQCKRKAVL